MISGNSASQAAKRLISLMAQVFYYEHEMRIILSDNSWLNPEYYKNDSKDWCLFDLVNRAFGSLPVEASEYLCRWIHEEFDCPMILSHSTHCLEGKYKEREYIQNWQKNFDRKREEIKFISDTLVPRGDVHYRYVYEYCSSKQIFVSDRVLVSDVDDDFWEENPYWFDYYGVEEDPETGLIFYLDYE